MTTAQIETKIINILTVMGFENIPAHDAPFHTYIDSLEVVELVINVEKAFDIGIANDEIDELETFDDLVAIVEGKVNGRVSIQ